MLVLAINIVQAQNLDKAVDGQWSKERINKWYSELPWLVGCNYYPATAINQIDMWQKSTWDPTQIKKELDWAKDMGMNTLRVYLHDLVWEDDEKGLYKRMDEFLEICKVRGIRPWFVFFDDCHFPEPRLGKQPLPVKAYHNSGWYNCPARELAERYSVGKATKAEVARIKGYVQETMRHFANDERILMWELYNEPGRGAGTGGDMAATAPQTGTIGDVSAKLVYDSWVWAREVNPSQPITSCTDGSVGKMNIAINQLNSDLYSIHSYTEAERLEQLIRKTKDFGRPVFVTEWLARDRGSVVEDCLPLMKELNVAAVNWGFVSGKSGTIWPWSSRSIPGKKGKKSKRNIVAERERGNVVKPGEKYPEPKIWFHDLLRMDGTAYDEKEIDLFKQLTKNNKQF